MNFKNTYIKLKDSDKTVERIKQIADKYSRASGCELEWYLKGDYTPDWDFIEIDTNDKVTLEDFSDSEDYLQEVTEQDLDNHLSTQLPNNEEDAKECCEGGQVSAGCFHDHCEGAVKAASSEEDVLNDVTKWGCFKEVANVLGEEDSEFELNKAKMKHLDGCEELELDIHANLFNSFSWQYSPQGGDFWSAINNGKLPEEYKTTVQAPFKPTLVIDDVFLKRIKGTFSDDDSISIEDITNAEILAGNLPEVDSIGSLVEKLYTSLSPSNVTIAVNGTGQIVICGDKIPTVDVTKLEADEITKAYEAMVMLEGLFVEYDGEEL